MNNLNPDTDPLMNKFRESFTEYRPDFSREELQNSWKSVRSNLSGVQPAHTGSFSKILTTKGIAVTSAIAVVVTSAIVLANIFLTDTENSTPVVIKPIEKKQSVEVSEPEFQKTGPSVFTNKQPDIQISNKKKKELTSESKANAGMGTTPVPTSVPTISIVPGDCLNSEFEKKIVSVPAKVCIKDQIHFYDTVMCAGDSFRFVFLPSDKSKRLSVFIRGEVAYVPAGYFAIAMTDAGSFLAIFEIDGKETTHVIRKQITVYSKPFVDFKVNRSASPNIHFVGASNYSSQYNWDFGDFSGSFEKSPVHTYLSEGSYKVSLIATSPEGCQDSVGKTIIVNSGNNIRIPNSFSPNNDGVNDEFFISIQNESYFSLVIYDRNNNIVFETESKDEKWDGTEKTGSKICLAGTYYFILRYKLDGDDKTVTKQGKIRLFR